MDSTIMTMKVNDYQEIEFIRWRGGGECAYNTRTKKVLLLHGKMNSEKRKPGEVWEYVDPGYHPWEGKGGYSRISALSMSNDALNGWRRFHSKLGYTGEALRNPCPNCERREIDRGDYLCHECRFGF